MRSLKERMKANTAETTGHFSCRIDESEEQRRERLKISAVLFI